MTGQPLTERLYAALASKELPLPVPAACAARVAAQLQNGELTTPGLATIASSDPVLACSLFRAANAAFFHGLPKAATIVEAVTRLGLEQAAAVIGRASQEGERYGRQPLFHRYLPPLWEHAAGCAFGARWLANRCGYRDLAEQAHLAGLLHDIGKWPLLASLEQLAGSECGLDVGERLVLEVVQTLHVDVGVRMVADWSLPDDFALTVGSHHQAGVEGQGLLVMLVRLANLGCRKLGLGWVHDPDLVLPITAEAQFLGIDEIILAEFEIMLEDRLQLAPAERDRQRLAVAGKSR